jgi:hypothetical protein
LRTSRIVVEQRRCRLQSIKEKMRLKLISKSHEVGLGELCFELHRVQIPKTRAIKHSIDVEGSEQGPIDEKADLDVLSKIMPQRSHIGPVTGLRDSSKSCFDQDPNPGHEQACCDVYGK